MPNLLLLVLSASARAEDPAVEGVTFDPSALVQVWVTAYDMDADKQADASGYGDPEDDEGVKLKRARLGISGGFKKWSYQISFGTSAPYDGLSEPEEPVEVVDAWIGAEPIRGLDVRVGKGKLPFSRDQLMGAGELVFTERGIASEHLVPDRSLGATVGFGRGGGKVTLGAFNAGGDLFGDVSTGKTWVGRLEWDLGKANTYRTWGDRKEFGFGVATNGYYRVGEATDTWAVGGDAILRAAGLSLLVDGVYSHVTPTETTVATPEVWEETDRYGVTGQLSYQVGAFEPAVKASMFVDSTLGGYSQVLVGGAWHTAEDHARIGVGYELRLEDQDPVDNDTVRLWAQFKL